MSGEISSFLIQVNTILEVISQGNLEEAGSLVKNLSSQGLDGNDAVSTVHRLQNLVTHLQKQTKKNKEHVQELCMSRDKFFSIISHDLRSPFNAILGFSDILTDEWDELSDVEKKTFLQNIKMTSRNTFDLLERILEWSRVQNGKMKLSPVKLDIFRLVQDIFLMFAEKAELKRIRMISEVIPGTTAWSDTDAIVLILRNLISNAIKFTGKGGLVTVSAIPTGQMLMITVADTGIGIVAGNIEKLFRFEHQFRQEGTEKEKGSGLGLVLCNDVVTKLGGRIWVESIEGAGSRFSFSIPFFPVVLDSKF